MFELKNILDESLKNVFTHFNNRYSVIILMKLFCKRLKSSNERRYQKLSSTSKDINRNLIFQNTRSKFHLNVRPYCERLKR